MRPKPALQELSSQPAFGHTTDEMLVRQARKNPDLFSELYNRYQQRIYTYHFSRTCNLEEAEELTAQTFLAAFENLGRFDENRNFAAWIFRIAYHKLVDYFRKHDHNLSLDDMEDLPNRELSLEEQVFSNLDMDAIACRLKFLPEQQCQALSLRIFGGLSALQVGNIMGKSQAAVKMLVLRGLRNLQRMLVQNLEVRS